MLPLLLLLLPFQAPTQDAKVPHQTQVAETKQKAEVPDREKMGQEDMSREEFLAALRSRLRTAAAPTKIDNFKIEAIFGAQGKKRGKVVVEAEILYRAPNYLRTTIEEGKKKIVRAQEKYKTWMSENGRAWRLGGRQYAEDRQAVRRDAALARLTARFLYPDRVLKDLVDPEGPIRAQYTIYKDRKRVAVEVWEMRGKARRPKDYPLVLSPEHEGDILVIAYFDKKTLQPARVYLKPLDKLGKPIPMHTEAIFFSEFHEQDGLQVPHRLSFFQPDPTRKVERLHKVSTIRIQRFSVPNEPWDKSLFRMPR